MLDNDVENHEKLVDVFWPTVTIGRLARRGMLLTSVINRTTKLLSVE